MIPRRADARRTVGLVLALLVLPLAPVHAAEESGRAAIPAYQGYVTDVAGVIPEPRRAALEGFLDQLQRKTGVQFAVLTMPSCAPESPVTFKTRVFQSWGIGDRERDDGLLFLVSMEEHELRFETGYGLEGTLPDGWQSRMIRDLVVPRFRDGDPSEGITAAVLASAQRIAAEKGVTLEWDGRELRYDESGGGRRLPFGVAVFLFVLLFMILPSIFGRRLRRRRRWWMSGGGGGFGGWGGGFGGGGFGGGGGSSFGGFGGGSSGGGGGGGRW